MPYWHSFVRKQFSENTIYFVKKFQNLLRQQEYLESTVSRPLQTLFYFHFKPQDLQEYIADLYRIAEVGFKQAQLKKNDYLLKYPEECMNGKPLKSTWTQAYKVFCREQNLQPWNLKNQQEFRMRIRAAWKRLVAGWNFIFPDTAKIQKCRAELARYKQQLQTTDPENRSKVNPGSPMGQPWVPDFWGATVGSRTKIVNRGSPRPVFSFACAGQPDQIVNL